MPELNSNRQFDAARLRDMRKRADSASKGKEEAEAIALECMEDIAEISSGIVVVAILNQSQLNAKSHIHCRLYRKYRRSALI